MLPPVELIFQILFLPSSSCTARHYNNSGFCVVFVLHNALPLSPLCCLRLRFRPSPPFLPSKCCCIGPKKAPPSGRGLTSPLITPGGRRIKSPTLLHNARRTKKIVSISTAAHFPPNHKVPLMKVLFFIYSTQSQRSILSILHFLISPKRV